MPNDAMLNAAEINAETEVSKIFFRPACELPAAVKRIVTEAYIKGYKAAQERIEKDTFIDKITL